MKKRIIDPQIKLPLSVALIPILSVLSAVIKICGLTSYDWLYVLIAFPIMMYLTLIVGCGIITLLALNITKLVMALEKDQERQ